VRTLYSKYTQYDIVVRGPLQSYVVAFNRDRDFYQVPAALAESAKLEALVTDLYLPDILRGTRVAEVLGVAHRYCKAVPSVSVKWSLEALWLQLIPLWAVKNERQRSEVFNRLDAGLSRMAGRRAARSGAGLLLYSGYALEAFKIVRESNVPRLLFVYHPQGDYARRILEEDFDRHLEVAASHQRHIEEISMNEGQRVAEEVGLATGVACASSFTAQSVRSCLRDHDLTATVIPYGCFPPVFGDFGRHLKASRPQVLFVGQGTQRKGLHHLLKVWREGFHQAADLTLVLNQVDPGIMAMISVLPVQPRVLKGLSREQLASEFQRADLFVLPSLVEGFGLVYLEALSAGCHVIGTHNTGLPDVDAPPEVATVIPAGNLDNLRAALETAIATAVKEGFDRGFIRSFAATRTWENFRKGIRQFVERSEAGAEHPDEPTIPCVS
jgi:glycosyltransferase involved in cell wall biosynthesis